MNNSFKLQVIIAVLLGLLISSCKVSKEDKVQFASKPLFRDPVFDGAADPSLVWNHTDNKWYMFYTNRRANVDSLSDGVKWVHGTKIGIAVSDDEGLTWTYKGTCNIPYEIENVTYWAPEVLFYKDTYHMYLTIVPGIFDNWSHPRYIIHLTSKDLNTWEYQSKLELASDKCIDACVFQLPNGNWRMYYNNERDHKSIYYADSPDLYTWKDSGEKIIGDERGEGPTVFQWHDTYWMIIDNWKGLGVYQSNDMHSWKRQPDMILDKPGTGEDDMVIGQHPDVVVADDGKAYIFYFTHPDRREVEEEPETWNPKRSSIQVAELEYSEDGQITCDRNKPVSPKLK